MLIKRGSIEFTPLLELYKSSQSIAIKGSKRIYRVLSKSELHNL